MLRLGKLRGVWWLLAMLALVLILVWWRRGASLSSMADIASPDGTEPASEMMLDLPVGSLFTLRDWVVWRDGREMRAPVTLTDGQLDVELLWEVQALPTGRYQVYVQLRTWDGRVVAESAQALARDGTPISAWKVGERIRDRHTLTLESPLPKGAYNLTVGMYLLDANGEPQRPLGVPLVLPGLKIPLDPDPSQPAEGAPLARYGGALLLVGLEAPNEVRVNEAATVRARWRVERPLAQDLIGVLQLIGPCRDGECPERPIIVKDEHRPLYGRYPTTVWSPDESVMTTFQFGIPPILPAGEYRLGLGWRDQEGEWLDVETLRADVTAATDMIMLPVQLIVPEEAK